MMADLVGTDTEDTIAFGCGCDTAQRYARLLVKDAPRIAEFLRKRYEQKRSEAERVLNALPKGEHESGSAGRVAG